MKNPHKRQRIILIGSIFELSAISLLLVITNFRDNMVFFYSPNELNKTEVLNKIQNRQIRVGGLVVKNSIKKIDALTTEFVITDFTQELKVQYVGILPDLFREQQGVVAKGKLDTTINQFFSKELLVKHDEKYMPPEVAKSLKTPSLR